MYLRSSSSRGDLFFTHNGGQNWKKSDSTLFKNPKSFIDFVHFFDSKNAVVVGDPINGQHEIYTTKDGGVSWLKTSSPATRSGEYPTINNYSAAGNSIWFGTNQNRLFKSNDKGISWEVLEVDVNMSPNSNTSNTVFKDSLVGFFIKSGGDSFYKTINGGVSWSKVKLPVASSYDNENFIYVKGNKDFEGRFIFANNYNNEFFYSVNDGESWERIGGVYNPSSPNSLGFYDVTHGWVAASYNRGNIFKLDVCNPKAPSLFKLANDTIVENRLNEVFRPCSNFDYTIIAKGQGVVSWYTQPEGDGLIVNNAKLSKKDIVLFAGKSTIYVQDSTCYVSARTMFSIEQNDDTNCKAGIQEIGTTNYTVYPNPTTGRFTISGAPLGQYSLLNELGAIIYSFEVKELVDQTIQIDNLSKGLYFLKGSDASFVKEKIVVID